MKKSHIITLAVGAIIGIAGIDTVENDLATMVGRAEPEAELELAN